MIDIDYLRTCLIYNPDTGLMLWRVRPAAHFRSEGVMRSFNKQFAGRVAGSIRTKGGASNQYGCISFTDGGRKQTLEVHRVAFALYHDYWPSNVDHFDGDTLNNRISNLRPATKSVNGRNRHLSRHNTSGIPGVSRNGYGWVAHGAGKPKVYLGRFMHIFEAACARKSYEMKNAYTVRHGEIRSNKSTLSSCP